jgi:hypothetical protein
MKWQNITASDLRVVVTKLSLAPSQSQRRSPHPVYWYYLDGKKILRVTLPNVHGGSRSVSTGFLKQVQNQLKLTTSQFVDLVECPLTSKEYEVIVRSKLNFSGEYNADS